MSGLLGWIVFSGIFISVLADDNGKPCIFDWEEFETLPKSNALLIDYSGQKISTLTEGGMTYHYITGPVRANAVVDNRYNVFYNIIELNHGTRTIILREIQKVCYFLQNIYPKFLLPIAGTHNDFPPQESNCPMKAGTTNIFPANNSKELVSPSQLDEGRYSVKVWFLKDKKPVGGIRGIFNVLRK